MAPQNPIVEPWQPSPTDNKSSFARLLKAAAAGDVSQARQVLIEMDLPTALAALAVALEADRKQLTGIIKAGEGQRQIYDEAIRKIKLIDNFSAKSLDEATKAEKQKQESTEVAGTAEKLVLAAESAANPLKGLELFWPELYGKEPLPHSGPLSSWMPPQRTVEACNKLNISPWKAGSWKTVKGSDSAEDDGGKRYRSF
jgi:hypothetical protein